MHRALPVDVAEYLGPAFGALVFILVMGFVKEPARRNFNAVFVGGAMGAYISGGLGLWELPFAAIGSVVAFLGLRSHRFIGVAWLMHSAWDLVHHLFGNPIWPFTETSSFGCMIFDAVIALWFIAGAPSLWEAVCARRGDRSSQGGVQRMRLVTRRLSRDFGEARRLNSSPSD